MNHTLQLSTDELICIAQSVEQNLQIAIDNDIPRRISFIKICETKFKSQSTIRAQWSEQDHILWSQLKSRSTKIMQPTI